jgi:ATP-dependent Lhr-like helicase
MPLSWLRRDQLDQWLSFAPEVDEDALGEDARALVESLDGGALFQHELVRRASLPPERVEDAQIELIAHGLLTCDTFGAFRRLMLPVERRRGTPPPGGRWSLLRPVEPRPALDPRSPAYEDAAIFMARQLLLRTGIVFRQTIARERQPIPWRDLLRALRTLELRGECLGGRFVAGFSGEQFALPRAAEQLHRMRSAPMGSPTEVSAADPLNYRGILTPDERVRPTIGRRVQVG